MASYFRKVILENYFSSLLSDSSGYLFCTGQSQGETCDLWHVVLMLLKVEAQLKYCIF